MGLKMPKLDAGFIDKVRADEKSLEFKPLRIGFDTTLEGNDEKVRLNLSNGDTKSFLMSKHSRFVKDLQSLSGYSSKILCSLSARHCAHVLLDTVRDRVIGVYRGKELIGIKDENPSVTKSISDILQQIMAVDPNFYVRESSWDQGVRKVFLVHENAHLVSPNDQWHYGTILERDEILEDRTKFQQFAYRLACSNGLIGSKIQLQTASRKAVQGKIIGSFEGFHSRVMELLRVPVDNAPLRLQSLMEKRGFSGTWTQVPIDSPTVYGIVNAITQEAQHRQDRRELESFAGRVVELCVNPSVNPIREALFGRV